MCVFVLQNWINDFLSDVDVEPPKLPARQLKLDRHGLPIYTYIHTHTHTHSIHTHTHTHIHTQTHTGLSRVLSLPKGEDVHETSICKSYRVAQGPRSKA